MRRKTKEEMKSRGDRRRGKDGEEKEHEKGKKAKKGKRSVTWKRNS